MLMASRMLHVKNGNQQTRNEAAGIFHDNGNDFGGLMVIGDGVGWVFMIVIMASRILNVKNGSQQTRNEAAGDNFDGGSVFMFMMVIMAFMTLQ